MICDLRGNWLPWSQLRNGSIVKIRTMYRHWPGYEYLYASVRGKYLVIIIKILRHNLHKILFINVALIKSNNLLIGWIYYDILRNRIDHEDVANHKQEWIVEKNDNDHMLRFQSNYKIGKYLTGDLLYEDSRVECEWGQIQGVDVCTTFSFHWLYVGSENPTWWKIIPAFPS